jgi:hypothetical protein
MDYFVDLLKIATLTLIITQDGIHLPHHIRRAGRICFSRSAATGLVQLITLMLMAFAPMVYYGLELAHCVIKLA